MQACSNYTQTKHLDYNAEQLRLPLDLSVAIDKYDPLWSFLEVIKEVNLKQFLKPHRGNQGHNSLMMMKDVLFAYMNQVYSLRQMEERCRNDIRFLYLSEEEVKKLKAERKLNTEDLDQVNGGYLYQSGSEDGYRIHLIDDKTGDDIATYYYFEWEDAEDMARNINVSDRYISWEEWCALREKNKKYTPERSDSGPVV